MKNKAALDIHMFLINSYATFEVTMKTIRPNKNNSHSVVEEKVGFNKIYKPTNIISV